MTVDTTPVLPNPVFEGSEKRVEIDFNFSAASPANGLRALARAQLDELMGLAACTIVSSRTNAELDAYVLSESSLFVYPTKWVLKTCGTTKLLRAVPRLLEMAAELNMLPRRCKYSRASFLFPEQQPFPHTSFEHEAFFLRQQFGHLGNGGSAYVLGDMFNGLQWHVYVADANGAVYADELHPLAKPTHKLEAARQFFRDPAKSAPQVTTETGIRSLVPSADIDDYVFEPCGYSMNGIAGGGFITIHITPEDGFSYASVEVSGFDPGAYDPADMVSRILGIFRPGKVSVSLSVDVASSSGEYAWGTLAARPHGYGCQSATCQELATGGRVAYYTFSPAAVSFAAGTKEGAPAAGAQGAAADVDAPLRPASPATVLRSTLRHMPSFSSLPSDSDYDVASTSSGDENEVSTRLAAALRQLGRSRSRSGSISPKSSIGAASEQGDAASAACAACKGSGVAVCAAPVAVAAAAVP
ncbi:S-adenosylmethionine decarboxylase [Scenedesmus sp. NREL 46B-D3]|nr:S-adenosylmethionine decarboxylase [Scenedesmus sp. NREL 46B-D3]